MRDVLYRALTSSDALFLAPVSVLTSFPMHLTLFSVPFLLLLSPSCLVWLPTFSFASLIVSTFSVFWPFSGFLASCVLTTSPHFPSSDPSGPESPSFSAHRPLPPPKVRTPQHTALCAAVHTLGLQRGLIAKVCLSPWG